MKHNQYCHALAPCDVVAVLYKVGYDVMDVYFG